MTSRFTWLNKLHFAPIVSALFGLVAAILVFATPLWLFERAVVATGLPTILPPARPPLGDTARLGSAFVLGLLTFVALWGLLKIVSRVTKARIIDRSQKARGVRIEPVVVAPHRAPIFAEQELGAPFMSQEAMDLARSELIMFEPLADDTIGEVDTVAHTESEVDTMTLASAATTDAEVESASVASPLLEVDTAAAAPVPAVHAIPVPAPAVGDESISGLLSRLDTALDRRSMAGKPVPLGDIASLRRALGAGR